MIGYGPIELHLDLARSIPKDARLGHVIYPDSLLLRDTGPKIPMDLPSIGADAIDAELLRLVFPSDISLDSQHSFRESIWFRFYTFRNGERWAAPEDLQVSADTKTKRPLNEYVLVSPVESFPFIMHYVSLAYELPDRITHHISRGEQRALGKAVLSLTPRYSRRK